MRQASPVADADFTLPPGRRVVLPGRGRTFVREMEGPSGAPTVLLVHGWLASSAMNWYRAYEPLSEHFRVVAPDLRGHGRGIRSSAPFSLIDCADDLAALVDTLDCGPVIAVGYSMGGPVTQLLCRRHPDMVAGLVQCSTTHLLARGRRQRLLFGSLFNYAAGVARVTRLAGVGRHGVKLFPGSGEPEPPAGTSSWILDEMRRHDARLILEAANAGSYYDATTWIGDIDVAAAVLATRDDRALPIDAQLEMASALPRAKVWQIGGDHLSVTDPSYGAVLVEACRDVARRAATGSSD